MARRYYGIGALLIVLGLVGFVVATPIGGVFETTPLLNVIHLLAGAATIVTATRGLRTMRAWGQWLGYFFAALSAAAFISNAAVVDHLVPLSTTNAWFHLLLALTFLYHALLAPPTL